jgi:hypothetical protein
MRDGLIFLILHLKDSYNYLFNITALLHRAANGAIAYFFKGYCAAGAGVVCSAIVTKLHHVDI